MSMLEGTIASRGYAYGRAFLWREGPLNLNPSSLIAHDSVKEKQSFHLALAHVKAEIQAVEEQAEQVLDAQSHALFASYQLLLEDEELIQEIENRMVLQKNSAAWAVQLVMDEHAEAISRLENVYLRERAADIRDLKQRLIKDLLGKNAEPIPDLSDRILVAEDLSPAQSVQMNLHTLQGLVTDRGGITSHTSILARALNIPAIVGARQATQLIQQDDWVLMDAVSNKVWINPEPELIQLYERTREVERLELEKLEALRDLPACTRDGLTITLAANIGLPLEAIKAHIAGAEGIGLFRTEFLFMHRPDLPSEQEQYEAYRQVLEEMSPHPVIIRTMDIGGDKDLPQLKLSKEDNPFLGLRGIRISLKYPDLLLTQLRALLRASAHGSLKIMFPMVSSVEELLEIRRLLDEVRFSLEFAAQVEIGIMIETPASVMLAPHLIRLVDFFSIGSNDLTQYTLAVDRGHPELSQLYQPLSPAVLLMMREAIRAANEAGKWASVCGEMAADPMNALLLIGLGARKLSMSANALARVKQVLRHMDSCELKEKADEALRFATVAEVKTLLDTWRSELPII